MFKSPITAQLELTYACNQSCKHCYNRKKGHQLKIGPISKEHLITSAKILAEEDVFSVTLTGGEPFIRRDAIFDIAQILNSKDIDIGINSNLTIFNEEDARKLADLSINSVLTSLNSYNTEQHNRIVGLEDSYNQILESIGLLKKFTNIPVSMNMVVTPENVRRVYKTGEFAITQLGIDAFYATPIGYCVRMGQGEAATLLLSKHQYLQTLEELVRLEANFNVDTNILEAPPFCIIPNKPGFEKFLERRCVAGRSTLIVSPMGEVRPCTHSNQTYGSLQNESLEKIWAKMKEWNRKRYVPKECHECAAVNDCMGGCRTQAEAINGSLSAKNPLMSKPLKTLDYELLKKSVQFEGDDKIEVIPNIKVRKESSNICTLYKNGGFLNVLESELELLKYIQEKGKSSVKELLREDAAKGAINDFLRNMIRGGFIKKV